MASLVEDGGMMASDTIPTRQESGTRSLVADPDWRWMDQLRAGLNAVLRGKQDVVESVLVCLLAHGHLLLEDKPGLGKTTLAKALAALVGGNFARIQCTPDLLPSDITGFNIFNQKSHEFEFRPGPVFADVLLADEINRATPRTQSALLEAMAERQVTVDAVRYALSDGFFVIATQNPIDQHGTYCLPEAQLDRFAMKLSIGYPHPTDEVLMLQDAVAANGDSTHATGPVLDRVALRQLQTRVARLAVAPALHEYLVQLSAVTRKHPRITLGLSPRGVLTWQRAAQARAFLQRRWFVTPDDIRHVATPVLSVRIGSGGDDQAGLVEEVLESVAVPEY